MLMLIGPVQFEIEPFNLTETTHSHGASHVRKPVIGGRQPLEFTGEDPETWSLRAVLFPQKFGGESALTVLRLLTRSGIPQYMFRGDGALMGWVTLDSVTERSSYLDASGVGRMIEVDISVTRSHAPTAPGYFSALSGLFGGLF